MADTLVLQQQYSGAALEASLDKAARAASKASELRPDLAEAWASSAILYARAGGQDDRAETMFRRAISLNPNYATAHQWFSDMLGIRGRREQALSHAQRAAELDPLSAIINTNLAEQLASTGRFDEAEARLRKAITIDPSMPVSHVFIGLVMAYARNRFADAVPFIEQAMELDPDGPNSRLWLAMLYLDLGREAQASGLIEAVQKHWPDNVAVDYFSAIVQWNRGDLGGVVVAGGMENMSQVPYAFPQGRWGARMFNQEMVDLMVFDGLFEIFYGYHMGLTAENIAEKFGISRKEQDELGLLSHQRARAAIKNGIFKGEIVPVIIPHKKGDPISFDTDERPMDTSLEKMAKLPTAFKPGGTVTAGNASGINDAAAAVLLMSKEKATALKLQPLGTIRSYASRGVDPAYMGLGPIPAVRKALKKANVSLNDIGLIELNEAFASQAIACIRELQFDMEKTNVNGSGISLAIRLGARAQG